MNPDLPFSYFFLGNSYDKMYRSARKGEAGQRRLPAEGGRQLPDRHPEDGHGDNPKEKEILNLSYQYLIAVYGADKLNDFARRNEAPGNSSPPSPTSRATIRRWARIYQDLGRYDDAEATFKKAIELRPEDGLGYQMLANFYNHQGNFDKTMEALTSEPRPSRTTPKRGTPSAASIRQGLP